MSKDIDVLVLGAGNAGLAAADAAARAGLRVVIVESHDVAGVCPLRGCVPKKVLVAAAQTLDTIARAASHEITVQPATLDWPGLIARKQTFVDSVPAEFEKSLANRGIELVRGQARFTGPNEVTVHGERYTAGKIVVATGSSPRALAIPGAENLITSDEILELPTLPESITFVGAGVIAFEFAHVFARAGTRVTILNKGERLLPTLDSDATDVIAAETRELGVAIETGVAIDRIKQHRDGFEVKYRKNGNKTFVRSQLVVNAAGRVANLNGLDLEMAGISREQCQVKLDASLRSVENPNVYFAGDAIPGRPQLSPVATYEGKVVGHNLINSEPQTVDYGFHPAAVYTVPALATVGLSEEAAAAAGLDFDVRVNDMRQWRSARTYAETAAWSKVLVEKGSGRILGAHLVGHGAEEVIHSFALAIEKHMTAREIASRVYAYPTFHSDLKFLV